MKVDELRRIFGSDSKALEILFLLYDLKPVVRQGFYDTEIGRVKDFCRSKNLAIEIAPYKVILADPNKKFSNKGFKARVDDPRQGMFFVYISKNEQQAVSARVYEMKNNYRSLGEALGYPDCCIDFFIKNEPERSKLDNDYTICTLKNSKQVRHPFVTNICKRHLDITLLSHFPCSFDCQESIEEGNKKLKLLEELDPNLAMNFIKQLKGRVRAGYKEIEFD